MSKASEMTGIRGKRCVITGATSGIGEATARALAAAGAELTLVCRSPEKGEATRTRILAETPGAAVDLAIADLSSQAEIRRVAGELLADPRPIHVLLNNAGVVNLRYGTTVDAIETTFAVNHLAYFLLTRLLLERICETPGARIVNVASDAHAQAGGRLDFDDLDSSKSYSVMRVYGKSKLANILFTRELARRLEGSGVTANCLHPGFVGSNFARNNGPIASVVMSLLRPFARSPEKGAETAVYLASSPEVAGVSGKYFVDCKVREPRDFARNDEDARRLWEVSEQLCGLAA